MKFMVSETGTLNTFRNEKHKHAHVKHRAEKNFFFFLNDSQRCGEDFLRDFQHGCLDVRIAIN